MQSIPDPVVKEFVGEGRKQIKNEEKKSRFDMIKVKNHEKLTLLSIPRYYKLFNKCELSIRF